MAKTQTLLVGDWQQREFATASAGIPDALDGPPNIAANIDEACDILRHCQQPPELIFLAQPLPGLYRQNDIERLQQLVPLTRLVIVAGTWCEGELRTGTPPNGVIRLYWYELASWWQANIRRRDAGQCPLWSLPLDNAQAGRWSSGSDLSRNLSSDLSCDLSKGGSLLSVLIDAADYAVYETLSATLGEQNILTSWQSPSWHRHDENATQAATATAGIWDGGQLGDLELTRLTHFSRQVDGPVIALLDFPRVEHIQQAQAAGAFTVFAKPYIVEEMVAALAQSQATEPRP